MNELRKATTNSLRLQKIQLPTKIMNSDMFLAEFAPGVCLRKFRKVRKIEDVVRLAQSERSVSLATIRKHYGEELQRDYLAVWLINLNESLNIKRPMTESMILETVDLALQDYYYLSIADIYLIFSRAKKGMFGELYESLNCAKVLQWFANYAAERSAIFEQVNIKQHELEKSLVHCRNKKKAEFIQAQLDGDVEKIDKMLKEIYKKNVMENKILVIDIETTGFLDQGGKIVEVGIVELDIKTGKKKIVFDSVVHEKPISKEEVERSWIVKNGYMNADEIRHSPELKTKIPQIQQIINKYPLGATAYNNQFDFGFLENRGIKIKKKLPCPMLLSTDICKIPGPYGNKWPKVQEAWEFFFGKDTGYDEKHRGADDAFHESDIVYELIKRGVFKIEEKK